MSLDHFRVARIRVLPRANNPRAQMQFLCSSRQRSSAHRLRALGRSRLAIQFANNRYYLLFSNQSSAPLSPNRNRIDKCKRFISGKRPANLRSASRFCSNAIANGDRATTGCASRYSRRAGLETRHLRRRKWFARCLRHRDRARLRGIPRSVDLGRLRPFARASRTAPSSRPRR